MNEQMNEYVNEQKSMNIWINMNQINEWLYESTNKQTKMKEWIYEQMNKQEWRNESMNKWTNKNK